MEQVNRFNEVVVFCDDRKRTWQSIQQALQQSRLPFIKLPSSTSIRHNWSRIASSPLIIVHWDNQRQIKGSVFEEILEVDRNFPLAEKIIVIVTEPSREDIIYFSEMGLQKIVRIANNAMQAGNGIKDLHRLLTSPEQNNQSHARQWVVLRQEADQLPMDADENLAEELWKKLENLANDKDRLSARYLDLFACLSFKTGRDKQAEIFWQKAVEINPNHARSYQGLIELYCHRKDYRRAIDLIQNLQHRNKHNISRLVKMGEIYYLMADELKAEHYFQLALERDSECSGALNGLASMRFRQGKLEESRKLLERSTMAYKLAAILNEEGIKLVKQGQFEDALDHYSKAQYVLPQYQKGPMLLYNIGLCYSRWGKYQMAEKFLYLALAKDPEYSKAQKLLQQIQLRSPEQHTSGT
ncbi:MAG: tetratricopeptide repeat protein [Oligoflexus sp.]